MLKLISKSTKELSTNNIKEICRLKDTQWKFGLKSQRNWFKNSVQSYDIHNCFYIRNLLIGYTLLKKRKLEISGKKMNYLLFDTLIIRKNLRKKKLSYLMMLFNNNVIKRNKKISFLLCKNELISFYKKFHWKKLNKKKLKIMDHTFDTNGMLFNCTTKFSKIKKPIKIYFNK